MGFGGGAVLIIFLTNVLNYTQTAAQGINLMFFIPCAAYALVSYTKNGLVDKKKVIPLILGGFVGIILGYVLLSHIPAGYLSKLFGGFVVLLGINSLVRLGKNSKQ